MKRSLLFLCCVSAYSYLPAQKVCLHTEYAEKQLKEHPEMKAKLASVEAFTYSHTGNHRVVIAGGTITPVPTPGVPVPTTPIPVPEVEPVPSSPALPALITIPVVVHVIYNSSDQNISEKVILSQIESLNNDYRNRNAEGSRLPAYFAGLASDCGIEFKLAQTDPDGYSTKGIVRKKTSVYSFGADDKVKHTATGGDDAWDASRYLNVWVCDLSSGVIGYSSLVGCEPLADGVVIHHNAFGSKDNNTPYNRGRTATHEIGHWLNLRHIWGDMACGDDKVDETPTQGKASRGCPSGKQVSCGNTATGDLYMNFMDLTNDECMYMFTYGQRERMRSMFLKGGLHHSLLTSNGLAVSLIPKPGAVPDDYVESDLPTISVYPNPAINTLTVRSDLPEAVEAKAYTIYNHLGQPVRQCLIKGKTTPLDVSKLSTGIYYLKSAAGNSSVKFIKVN